MEDTTPPQDIPEENSAPSGHLGAHGGSNATAVMKRAVSEFVSARMELAAIEAKEAAEFTIRKVVSAVVLTVCAFFTWTLVLAGLAGLLAGWAENLAADRVPGVSGWVIILFALAILHALVAIIFLLILKKKPAVPLFELTRQEIKNDKAWAKSSK